MFIVLEGIDGSGKTTQANLLSQTLSKLGYDVLSTREPGGTDLAEKIRELLMLSSVSPLPVCEIMLFTIARYDHYIRVIRPALLKKKIVICDRFIASTLAYQSYCKLNESSQFNVENFSDVTKKFIIDLHQLIFQDFFKKENILISDCTFFLDIPLKIAMHRMGKKDNFEIRGDNYYNIVINNYKKLKNETENYYIIDATNKKQKISSEIMCKITPLLHLYKLSNINNTHS